MATLPNISTRTTEPEAGYVLHVENERATLPFQQDSFAVADDSGITTGKWDVNLFDCFSFLVPNCLMVSFCPCVALAQIGHRLNVAPFPVILLIAVFVIGVEFVIILLTITAQITHWIDDETHHSYRDHYRHPDQIIYRATLIILEVNFCVFIWHLRRRTRDRFRIPGSHCEDCVESFFCSCCATAQMATHIKSYQTGTYGFGIPGTLPAYK